MSHTIPAYKLGTSGQFQATGAKPTGGIELAQSGDMKSGTSSIQPSQCAESILG